MTANRYLPLRIGAVFFFCVLGSGCGSKSFSLSDPNDARLQQSTRKTSTSGLAKVKRDESPFRLTSSEGTDLRLTQLEVKGVAAGPLAFTELHLTFKNAEPRVIEGRFRVTLPETASISRFAMKTSAGWQEGEMVEKNRARTVYEDFLHRRQDPALLEKALGNEFSARVFPIAAYEEKHLVLAYSEEILDSKPYTVALFGIPTLDQLNVDVTVKGPKPEHLRFERKGMAPTEDLLFDTSAGQVNSLLQNENLAVMRVRPQLDEQPETMGDTIILFDTSASRAPGFDQQLALLESLARRIAQEPNTSLTVAAFDQAQELMYQGKSSGFGPSIIDRILRRAAMGATDIHGALAWASHEARLHAAKRLILVTDGVTTMRDVESDPIVPTIRALRDVGIERLDVVLSGGIRDSNAARGWINQLPKLGMVLDAEQPFATIERRLTQRVSGRLAVEVEGATWFWPIEFDGLQNGEEVLVYAELTPKHQVALRLGAQSVRLRHAQFIERALLERAWARAKIANLVERQKQDLDSQELVRQVVDLSQRFRVISPFTALLVLESNADYSRFNVRRDPNVLQIVNGQVVASAVVQQPPSATSASPSSPRQKRYAVAGLKESQKLGLIEQSNAGISARAPSPPALDVEPRNRDEAIGEAVSARDNLWGNSIGDALGSGGLGLSGIGEGRGEGIGLGTIGASGHGASAAPTATAAPRPDVGQSSGFGSGNGRLSRPHRIRAPIIRAGSTTVSGQLPPEVIQRIVRQNYGRFRSCYEQGLAQNPKLEGRVQVRFVIDRAGRVTHAVNAGSALPNATVVSCVIAAFRVLEFPAPEGGLVTVSYPIQFEPGDGVAARSNKTAPSNSQPERYDEPWDGKFAEVMAEITAERLELALARAQQWRDETPSDLLAWVALGRAYRARGERENAARALGSIIDLWGFRADLRRFVAGELEALHPTDYLDMAIDSYRHALADRPDHPSSRLWLAIALMKQGDLAEAMKLLETGWLRGYDARYRESKRIFAELIQLCAAAQIQKRPQYAALIRKRIEDAGLTVADVPSARFLLTWETDANDVDFHVFDQTGTLAYYSTPVLPDRGGELYADVTDGYGPECFGIDAPRQRGDRRYSLFAHYFRRGPMGAGLGKLEIVEHDGKGKLSFESRPYVVTRDGARVPLGDVAFERKIAAK